jgi:hypothetical protein
MDVVASYEADTYVTEFWYLDHGLLQYNNQSLDSYTTRNVILRDLLIADSTTFLFKFYDSNYLIQPEAIVTVLRDYIGNGLFKEVERSKQDNNGETHIHLVQEDVLYKFRVTLNGIFLYESAVYNAKCLSTPCSITLEQIAGAGDQPSPSLLKTGTFNLSSDESLRLVSLAFNLNQTGEMNLTVYQYVDGNPTPQAVASEIKVAKSGVISLTIPQSYGNVTYISEARYNTGYIGHEFLEWSNPMLNLGTFGLILAFILILSLGLIALSHGVWTVIFVVIGFVFAVLTTLIKMDYLLVIWLICLAVVVIWKVSNRRVG